VRKKRREDRRAEEEGGRKGEGKGGEIGKEVVGDTTRGCESCGGRVSGQFRNGRSIPRIADVQIPFPRKEHRKSDIRAVPGIAS